MLKWAVNGPRQSYSQNEEKLDLPKNNGQQQRKHLKRKSLDICNIKPKASWQDKENQYTSTPLHTSSRSFGDSPLRKLDSLKDLSNIVPELNFQSPKRLKSANTALRTPQSKHRKLPNNYATTLPTFDVEYSPCGLIPGPILALRGVGIPDSYFEKPRYITQHTEQNVLSKETEDRACREAETKAKTAEKSTIKYPSLYMEESTLNSAKMGDVTLEQMIDAILASTRKDTKALKSQKHGNMSPTYTPADDPASDLHEIWDSEKARYRQQEQKFRAKLTKKALFKEREICSPHHNTLTQHDNDTASLLKRQRGVRRKRKITKITASVMNSAQKLLSKSVQTPFLQPHSVRKVLQSEIIQDEVHPQKLLRNLSPDSGHNSSSDFDEAEEEVHSGIDADTTLAVINNAASLRDITKEPFDKTFDLSKRRLSFTIPNLTQN